jgi:hypothetical protein
LLKAGDGNEKAPHVSAPHRDEGTHIIEFKAAHGETLAISIPRTECVVIRHFQERRPYGLFVPDVP